MTWNSGCMKSKVPVIKPADGAKLDHSSHSEGRAVKKPKQANSYTDHHFTFVKSWALHKVKTAAVITIIHVKRKGW